MVSTAQAFVAYVEQPPSIRIKGGMVHIEDCSGSLVFRRAMPISVFCASHREAGRILSKWRLEQSGKIERLRGRSAAAGKRGRVATS
jgi:hypothetical protein